MTSILIVEDDITYGMMLKTWLGKKGFQVTSASSIARAQKHIESGTVDLILSDLRLPDKDGIDLLKWLGERNLQIPLIIMTGYADDGGCPIHETGSLRLYSQTDKSG